MLFRYLYERELTGNFGFLVYATALPGRRNSVPRHVRTTLLQDERARRRTSVVERTLLPAMTSSFSSPLGDVDVNDHDAEVPAHEGRGRRLALWWLVDSVLSPREYEAELFQRYALAAIYYATGGDAWTRCSAPPRRPLLPVRGGVQGPLLQSPLSPPPQLSLLLTHLPRPWPQ